MYVPGAVFILHIHCFGPTRSPIRRYSNTEASMNQNFACFWRVRTRMFM